MSNCFPDHAPREHLPTLTSTGARPLDERSDITQCFGVFKTVFMRVADQPKFNAPTERKGVDRTLGKVLASSKPLCFE